MMAHAAQHDKYLTHFDGIFLVPDMMSAATTDNHDQFLKFMCVGFGSRSLGGDSHHSQAKIGISKYFGGL